MSMNLSMQAGMRSIAQWLFGRPVSVLPSWEPSPWDADEATRAAQRAGWQVRRRWPITWTPVPVDGAFGHRREWFDQHDVVAIASHGDESLLLIQLMWHGWPDPPEWGLASRIGPDAPWTSWGFFPSLPQTWRTPEEIARC